MDKSTLKRILASQKADLQPNLALVPRDINLDTEMATPEITVLVGARRVGKSSLLEQSFLKNNRLSHLLYLNFEDPQTLDFEADDFLKLYEIWLEQCGEHVERVAYFDEIQNAVGWERWMNFFSKQKGFKVFITGSNSTLLSSELATHLTGRHRTISVYPLSFREILAAQETQFDLDSLQAGNFTLETQITLKKLTERYIKIGGFPRAWVPQETSILHEYYSNILNRDIVRRKKLRNVTALDKLGLSLMSTIGRKLNKSKLAETIGLKDAETVEKYIRYFEECFLGFQIRKFSSSIRAQLRNYTKFYAIDCGLAQRVGIISDSQSSYHLENLVLIELMRRGGKIYYWDSDKAEVDFVVETSGRERHLVQVCWDIDSPKTLERELKAFKEFEHQNRGLEIHKKVLVTLDGQAKLFDDVRVVPFYLWAIEP
jgi:predicted AAA+ superfamily ATPase